MVSSIGKTFSTVVKGRKIHMKIKEIIGDNYFGNDRVVDDLIRRLRKKMPDLDINTIYGYGYRLL